MEYALKHTTHIDNAALRREYAHRIVQNGGTVDPEIGRFVTFGMFSTLTNVNFDPERFRGFLREAQDLRDALARHPKAPGSLSSPQANFSCPVDDMDRLVNFGKNVA